MNETDSGSITYSFVIPVLDERDGLEELHRRLACVMDQLDGPAEVVFVDDGSTDGSFELMRSLSAADDRVLVVRLSRNFGHQIALTAGLDHARGRAVIIMDADLQDPPEVALAMIEQWKAGYAVVYAVRDGRRGESRAKLATAKWFYRVLARMTDVDMPVDTGDFRLVDRQVVDAVGDMRESRRYLRGMFAWVGFDQTGVPYQREARETGTTKFSFARMVRFATDGIASFSTTPLRLALALGFVVSTISLGVAAFSVGARLLGAEVVPGWASLLAVVGVLGGVQLLVLGVIGEYIARIYDEVKRRPLYLVREQVEAGQSR